MVPTPDGAPCTSHWRTGPAGTRMPNLPHEDSAWPPSRTTGWFLTAMGSQGASVPTPSPRHHGNV